MDINDLTVCTVVQNDCGLIYTMIESCFYFTPQLKNIIIANNGGTRSKDESILKRYIKMTIELLF